MRIIAGNWGALFLAFGLSVTAAGVWLLITTFRNKSSVGAKGRIIGAILLVIGGLGWSYLQTLIPTRYAINPTRAVYSNAEAAAVARPLYDEHCAICHGDLGRGDGPIADFMSPRPADFSIHGWHHREGEHYWWISRGIPGTGMPSFGTELTEEERWLLARFVKQLGREARMQ